MQQLLYLSSLLSGLTYCASRLRLGASKLPEAKLQMANGYLIDSEKK